MLQQPPDGVECHLGEARVAFPCEEVLTFLPQGEMHVHYRGLGMKMATSWCWASMGMPMDSRVSIISLLMSCRGSQMFQMITSAERRNLRLYMVLYHAGDHNACVVDHVVCQFSRFFKTFRMSLPLAVRYTE